MNAPVLNRNDSNLDHKSDDNVEMRSNGSSNEVHSKHQVGYKKSIKPSKLGRNYKLDRKNPQLIHTFDKVSKNEKVD